MSTEPTVEGISWISELLQRLPAHSLMAGLFVYFILHIIPEKEAWYWGQLEKQRVEFFAIRQTYEDRKDAQIRDIEQLCYGTIQRDLKLSEENASRLDTLAQLVKERCSCP